MHHFFFFLFFFWIPYSLRNVRKKVENFSQPVRLIENQPNRLDEFQLKFIMGAHLNLERPSLFWSYLRYSDLESRTFSFVEFLTL